MQMKSTAVKPQRAERSRCDINNTCYRVLLISIGLFSKREKTAALKDLNKDQIVMVRRLGQSISETATPMECSQ